MARMTATPRPTSRRTNTTTGPAPRSSPTRVDRGSTVLEVDPAQAADVAHPALGQTLGGLGGGDRVGPGEGEDGPGGLEDPARSLLGALEVEPLQLVGHLD